VLHCAAAHFHVKMLGATVYDEAIKITTAANLEDTNGIVWKYAGQPALYAFLRDAFYTQQQRLADPPPETVCLFTGDIMTDPVSLMSVRSLPPRTRARTLSHAHAWLTVAR
jgi:predicted nuclease of predicted toxin-antitoxin system